MKRFIPFLLVLLALFIPRPTVAGTTGKISGKVIDASTGEPLIGANVLILGTQLGASSGLDGSYFIINVPPGNYEVRAAYVGYQTVIEKGVAVDIDRTTPITFELPEGAIQTKAVVVTAQRQRIIRDLTATSEQVTAVQIQKLPVEGLTDILQLQVGMTQDPGGGLHLRGGRSDEIQYIVDGMPVVDPFGSGLAVDVQNNDIQQLQVISGTFNAEYGQAMSGVVNIVTKAGGDKLQGNIEAYSGEYETSHPSLFYDIGQQRPLGERYVQGDFGGPIPLLSRTHFFFSGRLTDEQGWLFGRMVHVPSDFGDFSAVNPADWLMTYGGDSSLVAMNPSFSYSYSAKITTSPFDWLKVTYSLISNFSRWKNYDHFNMFNPGYDPTNRNWAYNNILTFTNVLSKSTYQTFAFSYYATRYTSSVYANPYDPRFLSEIHYNLSVPGGIFNVGGVDNGFQYDNSYTTEAKYDITSQVNESNLLKFGVDLRDIKMKEEDFTVNDNPQTGFRLKIDPLTAFDHNAYNHSPIEAAAYLQDKLEVKDFVMNAGLRYDYFTARYYVPINMANPMNKNPDVPGENLPFSQGYRYVDPKAKLSPRLGIAFPISDVGSLHASFGEFFQMPDLQQVYMNPGFKVQGVYQSVIGNADINPEETTAYEIGIQQEMTSQLILDATCYYKDIRNLSGVTFFRTFDQVNYAEITNANYGYAWGITLELRLLQTGMLSSDINYTYQVAEGNGSDPLEAFYDQQSGNEATRIIVPLSWDQTHVLNWVVNLTGEDWGVSAISRFNSGNPYTPNVIDFIASNIQLLNLGRRLSQFNLDLQAYKDFSLGVLSAQVFLRVDNVFDQTLQEYFPVFTPQELAAHAPEDYLNSLYAFDYNPASQPMPRLIKLGIKLNY